MDSASLAALALRMTTKFGVSTNLLRTTNTRGTGGARVISHQPIVVMFAPEENTQTAPDEDIKQRIVGYVALSEPAIGDNLIYRTVTYVVDAVDTMAINGIAVCWKVVLS